MTGTILPETEASYHAPELGVASSSALKAILRSPAHYRQWLAAPTEPTPAMRFGTACHLAVLEPDRYEAEVLVAPDLGDGRTTAGKLARADWAIASAGRVTVSADDDAAIRAIAAACRAHRRIGPLLARLDWSERSVRWTDPESGVTCKARPDGWAGALDALVDLKTTDDARSESFARKVASYSYHVQAAHYEAAMNATGAVVRFFALVVAERDPPHGVRLYTLGPESSDIGARERGRGLRLMAECLASGSWPGYGDDIEEIEMPAWARRV